MQEELEEENKIEWMALEYEHKKQNTDWFWALGVIVIAVAISSIIYENYFFAILIVLSGVLLVVFTVKAPDMIMYELNKKGLKIKTRLYPYEKIQYFWVQKYDPENPYIQPMLLLHTERMFLPVITIPLEERVVDQIRTKMLEHKVSEKEMSEHNSHKILDMLGF